MKFDELVQRLHEMAVSNVYKTSQLTNTPPDVPTGHTIRDYKMMTTTAGIKNITRNFAKAVNQDIVLVVVDHKPNVNQAVTLNDLSDETKLAINKLSTPNNIVLVSDAYRGQHLLTPWMLGHRWGHTMMNDGSGAYERVVSLVGKYIVKNRNNLVDLLLKKYQQYTGSLKLASHNSRQHSVKLDSKSRCEVETQKFKDMCHAIVDAYDKVSETLTHHKIDNESSVFDMIDAHLDFSGSSVDEIPTELWIESLLFRPSIVASTDFRSEMFNNVFAYYVKFGKMPITNLQGSDNVNLEQGIVETISDWIDDQKGGVYDISVG